MTAIDPVRTFKTRYRLRPPADARANAGTHKNLREQILETIFPMRKNLRRLKRPSRVAPTVTQAAQKSWAERHTPLATIVAAYSTLVAVIIAGIGYYFTVIPLYQKAAVDEQLAKREVELKQLDERLVLARGQAYELARARLLDRLAIGASWNCAAGRGRISLVDDKPARTEDKRTLEERMAPSISECLNGFTERAAKSEKMTEADLQKLRNETNKLGAELDYKRLETIERVREVAAKARHDEHILNASTLDARFQEIAERAAPYWTPEQQASSKEMWFLARVQSVQLGIASKHWAESSEAIRNLYWSGVWPRINVTE